MIGIDAGVAAAQAHRSRATRSSVPLLFAMLNSSVTPTRVSSRSTGNRADHLAQRQAAM